MIVKTNNVRIRLYKDPNAMRTSDLKKLGLYDATDFERYEISEGTSYSYKEFIPFYAFHYKGEVYQVKDMYSLKLLNILDFRLNVHTLAEQAEVFVKYSPLIVGNTTGKEWDFVCDNVAIKILLKNNPMNTSSTKAVGPYTQVIAGTIQE